MPIQLLNRQTSIPSANGVSSVLTATSAPAGSSLLFSQGSNGQFPSTAPPFVSGFTPVVTASSSTSILPSQSSPSPSATSNPSSSSKISLGAVIGICIGVFVVAGFLIYLAIYLYRRSYQQSRNRGTPGSTGRVGRASAWSKLGDSQDVWDRAPQTREVDSVGLKKSPSLLKKTPSQSVLIKEFASKASPTDQSTTGIARYHDLSDGLDPPVKPFFKQSDNHSWDGTTAASAAKDESYLAVHIEHGTMSPTLSPAKTTPIATASPFHRWESAEVIVPDQSDQYTENPFADTPQDSRKKPSSHNPFFGAQQRRPSVGRKSFDRDTTVGESTVEPVPSISHSQQDSVATVDTSATGADRAMRSLIAALELPQEEVERRLRIASMQPSEISNYSAASGESMYA